MPLNSALKVWKQDGVLLLLEALQPRDVYLVGGAVRDLILGRAIKDFDFLVDASATELLSLQSHLQQVTGATVIVLDPEFGTLRVCRRGEMDWDLAARQGDTVMKDLARRDLSFNAMAIDREGNLLDPFDGCRDLHDGVVRLTSPKVLKDDPLRLLRCLRIAAELGFDIDPGTFEQLGRHLDGLEQVAGERVRDELQRFLSHTDFLLMKKARELGLFDALFQAGQNEIPWCWLEQWWQTTPGQVERSQETVLSVLAAMLFSFPSDLQEKALERLRLSRPQTHFIKRWWTACRSLLKAHPVTPREIYFWLSLASSALETVLSFVVLPAFGMPLEPSLAKRLRRAASGGGELRLDPLPLDGEVLCSFMDLPPGPWTGELLLELKAAWACREVDDSQGLLQLARARHDG